MKKKNKNCMQYVVAISVCVAGGIVSKTALAEGHHGFSGSQGVNRSIRTQSKGYIQAAGVGSMSFSNLPKDGGKYIDKPSFYLGGHVGNSEVDAGLQYEPTYTNFTKPGWSAFISWNGIQNPYCNPKVLNTSGQAVPWRGSVGPADISTGMNFVFFRDSAGNITAGITINALSFQPCPNTPANYPKTFYYKTSSGEGLLPDCSHPIGPWKADTLTTGSLTSANVKRVTAMTRKSGGSSLDGSQVIGTWSNGGVTRIYVINGEQTEIGGSWIYDPNPDPNSGTNPHLVQYMVDQGATGYDSPANGISGAKDGQKNYIVDFPSLSISSTAAREENDDSHYATQGGVSRYTSETVKINLLNPGTRGKGKGK